MRSEESEEDSDDLSEDSVFTATAWGFSEDSVASALGLLDRVGRLVASLASDPAFDSVGEVVGADVSAITRRDLRTGLVSWISSIY